MKIGFVLDDTLDSTDGVQQYVLTLGHWLASQGHEVHYLVGATTRSDLPHLHSLSRNMRVRFNGNRMSMPLPANRRRIHDLLEAEQFDVLHIQVPYSPLLAHRVIKAAPARTAVVGTFHIAPHSWWVTSGTWLIGKTLSSSLRRFDRMVSVSRAAAGLAQTTYGVETDIIPNAVATAGFAAARPFAQYEGTPTLMFLGRLVPRKGCKIFLEALHELRQLRPELDFRAIVAGRGPLKAELKRYADDNGLYEYVEFTGYISDADKARYLASSDIAVFPSSGGESFGIVLVEAMAAGHPVVLGADNPGYRTVLEACPELLFPVGDSRAVAAKIAELLADPAAVARLQAWQAANVGQYDVAAVGRRIVEVYHTALARRAELEPRSAS